MAKHETHGGRVEWEGGVPEEVIHDLVSLAWPGVFSGGKQIVASKHQPGEGGDPDELILVFNDNTAIRIYGAFEVTYRENVSAEGDDVIEGEAQEEKEPQEITEGG